MSDPKLSTAAYELANKVLDVIQNANAGADVAGIALATVMLSVIVSLCSSEEEAKKGCMAITEDMRQDISRHWAASQLASRAVAGHA